jgi:feruloyl esterase
MRRAQRPRHPRRDYLNCYAHACRHGAAIRTAPSRGASPSLAQFDFLQFDFDKDPQRVEETAALQDATWTELSTFSNRGGKLILYHGVADPYFSANDTARYYTKLLADNGGRDAMSWARLFLIPGMTHCSGGPAPDDFDALGAIVAWVEQGQAPDRIEASGVSFPGQKRPLCPYPAYAHYKGAGSPADANSFECRIDEK